MIAFLLSLLAVSGSAARPYYTCTLGDTTYSIILEADAKALAVSGKGKVETLSLTGPNTVLPRLEPGGPQWYFRENRDGRTPYTRLDLGTGVRIHYAQANGKTEVTIGIVRDHRELRGLKCRTTRFKTKVVELSQAVSVVARHAEPILMSVDLRDTEGDLTPEGIMGVETGIRRFVNSSPNAEQKKQFFEAIAESLHRVSDVSMRVIARRLPKDMAGFWDELMKGTRYPYYPTVQRYVDWIEYGFRNTGPTGEGDKGVGSIVAGMREFGRSGAFEVKDFQEFFSRALKGRIDRKISPALMFRILEGVPEKRHRFFIFLWQDRNVRLKYARLKKVYDEYARPMIRGLSSPPVKQKGKPPVRVFSEFTRAYYLFRNRPVYESEENRELVRRAVAPYLRKLTPEELEELASKNVEGNPDFFWSLRNLASEAKNPRQ